MKHHLLFCCMLMGLLRIASAQEPNVSTRSDRCYHDLIRGNGAFVAYHNHLIPLSSINENKGKAHSSYPFKIHGELFCVLANFSIKGLNGEDVGEYEDLVKVIDTGHFNLYLHCAHLTRDRPENLLINTLEAMSGIKYSGRVENYLITVEGQDEIFLIPRNDQRLYKESVIDLFLKFGPPELIDEVLSDEYNWEMTPQLIQLANKLIE